MGFLTVKEPSTAAFLQYAEEQKRAAALKSPRTVGLQTVSQQKLPDHVPKVNSKWDGMPKVSSEQSHGGWKQSSEASTLLSRMSKRSTSNTSWSSHGNSAVVSKRPSASRSRGGSSGSGSARSSPRNSQKSSPRTGSGRSSHPPRIQIPPEPLSLSRSPSNVQSDSFRRPSDPKDLPILSTHNLILDGNDTARPSPVVEIVNNTSSETLKGQQRASSLVTFNQPSNLPLRNDIESPDQIITSSEKPPDLSHIHPALRPAVNLDAKQPMPLNSFSPHSPDDVFPDSPHVQPLNLQPVLPLKTAPVTDNLQWPLSPLLDSPMLRSDEASVSPPKIPVKSPSRQQPTASSSPPHSPVSPPQSPNRAGTASPRNFARPFNTAPLTPPTPQSPTPAPLTPSADSIAGPVFLPFNDASSISIAGPKVRTMNTFTGCLRPPALAPGRVLTKDSPLEPIPEVDTASMISIPIDPDAPVRESHVLPHDDPALIGSEEPSPRQSLSSDEKSEIEAPNVKIESRTSIADSVNARSDADAMSIRSELSVSWYRSPKERLGLGGLIRHDRSGIPWPVEQVEDIHFVPAGTLEANPEASDAAKERKKSLRGFMKW